MPPHVERLLAQFRTPTCTKSDTRHAGQPPDRVDRDRRRPLRDRGKETARLASRREVRGRQADRAIPARGSLSGRRARPWHAADQGGDPRQGRRDGRPLHEREAHRLVGRPPRRHAPNPSSVSGREPAPARRRARAPRRRAAAAARWPGSARGRSACTSMSRSAPAAAATATSTRTSRVRAPPATGSPTRSWRSGGSRAGCSAARPRRATVFMGGGTPTLLPVAELARLLDAIPRRPARRSRSRRTRTRSTPVGCARCAAPGSRACRSACRARRPACWRRSSARHTPGGAVAAARLAREAGFEHVSLDLIYGTPGERDEDWAASLAAALDAGVDHVSAYALLVEPGTRLHARVRAGALAAPDDEALARRYRHGRRGARRRRAWGGTRSATGRPARARAPRTTSATGARTTGGASARARTRTSAACAGGTCCTRRATRAPSPAGRRRPPAARWLTAFAAAHGADDARAPARRGPAARGGGARPRRGSRTTDCSTPRAGARPRAAHARGPAPADRVARELLG